MYYIVTINTINTRLKTINLYYKYFSINCVYSYSGKLGAVNHYNLTNGPTVVRSQHTDTDI